MLEAFRSLLRWPAHLLGLRDTDYDDDTIGPEPDALMSTEKETPGAHSAPPLPKRLLFSCYRLASPLSARGGLQWQKGPGRGSSPIPEELPDA